MIPAPDAVIANSADEDEENVHLAVGDHAAMKEKTHPRLIVCEGISDKVVILALMKAHKIDGIQVVFAGGNGNFSIYLRAARTKKYNWVLLIADEDDTEDEDESFKKVQSQLVAAKYTAPQNRRQQVMPLEKNPGVEILMVPWDKEKGCIETVCLPAFERLYPDEFKCLEKYADCTGAIGWSVSQNSEMKIHCLLGGTQKKNPRVGLQIFAARNDCPLDFKHTCFDRIVDYLRQFAARPV